MAEYIERTEELMLAMNAGARAIENTKRYHGAIYNKDLFSDNPQEIPYLLAAKVLREVSGAPAVDVAPIRHGHWIRVSLIGVFKCSECGSQITVTDSKFAKEVCLWCLHCGARMDGGDDDETD